MQQVSPGVTPTFRSPTLPAASPAAGGIVARTPTNAPPAELVAGLQGLPSQAPQRNAARIALVGGYAPRKCGIATFTTDIREKLAEHCPAHTVDIYAMDDAGQAIRYADDVVPVPVDDARSYRDLALRIERSGADVLWLQHEYGIFGGPDGEMVLELVERVGIPIIATLHTVLERPSERQEHILRTLGQRASRIMVMAHRSRDLLASRYGVPHERIEVIEHGAPDRPFGREDRFKAQLGLTGKTVLTTFGLLGPGKGLETAIRALPRITASGADVVYRIVGATHPNLVAHEGEAYREGLQALAEELGVAERIEWDNRFLDTEELLDALEACDIYLTPYPNLQQSTSGTLSYAVALGNAVVSTPYIHASELLADGVGCLVEPESAEAIADAVCALIDTPEDLAAMKLRAYRRGRDTIWSEFAARSSAMVEAARVRPGSRPADAEGPSPRGVLAMSDDTGMLQHAIGPVPDRAHGYCVDDNARALIWAHRARALDPGAVDRAAQVYAAFLQSSWNEERGAFRNFMAYDRSWLEQAGSEDSGGRALWALGDTASRAADPELRDWAWGLYNRALDASFGWESPRARAFAVLGAVAALGRDTGHAASRRAIEQHGQVLHTLLAAARRPDWAWFEVVLAYDNPRLSEALIRAGSALDRGEWVAEGLDTLRWIVAQQTAPQGHFRPVGSDSLGRGDLPPMPFDQQPLEAQAAIEACLVAYAAQPDIAWLDHAGLAWQWFLGKNDRGAVLADFSTGRCHDGLTPQGLNKNCGAESILAFHLAHYSMIALSAQAREAGGERSHGRDYGIDDQFASHPR